MKWEHNYRCAHLTNEETEAQRNEVLVHGYIASKRVEIRARHVTTVTSSLHEVLGLEEPRVHHIHGQF